MMSDATTSADDAALLQAEIDRIANAEAATAEEEAARIEAEAQKAEAAGDRARSEQGLDPKTLGHRSSMERASSWRG